MPEPLEFKKAQRIRDILPHTKIVVPADDTFWEGWETECQDQSGSGDLSPVLLPLDPEDLGDSFAF